MAKTGKCICSKEAEISKIHANTDNLIKKVDDLATDVKDILKSHIETKTKVNIIYPIAGIIIMLIGATSPWWSKFI